MYKTVQILGFIISSILFSLPPLLGQNAPCLTFDTLENGMVYGRSAGSEPGEIIFSEQNVQVSIDSFHYLNGIKELFDVTVTDEIFGDNFPQGEENYLFASIINLQFDFSQLSSPIGKVCFDFMDGGGAENIAVNGFEVKIVESFLEIDNEEIAPGVFAFLDADPNTNLLNGQLCLEGDIKTLLVGGQELALDNFCFFPADPPACGFENIETTVTDCDEEDNYTFTLDFTPIGTQEFGFDVFFQNQALFFEYTDLPVTLEGFPANNSGDISFTICDSDNPNCCKDYIIKNVSCPTPPATCLEFEDIEIDTYGASSGNQPGDVIYTENDVPLILVPFQQLIWLSVFQELTVYDAANNTNFTSASGQFLFYRGIGSAFDFTGLSDQVEKVSFDFYYEFGQLNFAVNGQSILILNDFEPGVYALSPEVTMEISYDLNNPFLGKATILGPIKTLLIGGENFSLDNLCLNEPENCSILDFTAETTPCENNQFFIKVDFEIDGPSADSFQLFLNNELQTTRTYNDLPVQLGPFDGNTNQVWLVEAQDLDNACSAKDTLGPITCSEECAITKVIVEPHPCEEGFFKLDVEVQATNPGALGYFIFVDGIPYGPFSYENVFETIGPFAGDGESIYDVLVLDIQNANAPCSGYTEFGPINCSSDCEIANISVIPIECDGDGTYKLKLDFEYTSTSEKFDVFAANGQFIGSYFYQDLPVVVENFPDRPNNEDFIRICDKENPNCCKAYEFEGLNCINNSACTIADISIIPIECDGESTYKLKLDFEYTSTSEKFDVFAANGQFIGSYFYQDLPVVVENFPDRPNNEDFIRICDKENPNCCKAYEFEGLNCGGNTACTIANISVNPIECDVEGTYSLKLDFEHFNDSGVGFDVFASNGQFIGFYAYDDLPVLINNFPERPNNAYDYIKVCDNDNPNCCKEYEFMGPDCFDGDDCSIQDLTAEVHPCTDEGTYDVDIEFTYENVSDEGFQVFTYNGFWEFQYGEPFYTIGPFDGDGGIYEIVVFDKGDANCKDTVYVGPIDCDPNTNCNLSNLVIEAEECNPNGIYDLIIDFNYQNPGNDFFDVIHQNEVIGFYSFNDLPVRLINFQDNGADVDQIKVCVNDQPNCCIEGSFETPDCTPVGVCNIFDLFAEAHPCDNGLFLLDVEWEATDTGDQGFSVSVNGQDQGDFSYDNDFITIGPFTADPDSVYRILFTDNQFPNCAEDLNFGPHSCNESPDAVVWPGDANSNNKADYIDLLNIGLAFGFDGPARADADTGIVWGGRQALPWEDYFADGVNYKHADCNGDGVVDSRDQIAILENYGLTHGPVEPIQDLPSTDTDPPIFVDLPGPGDFEVGAIVEIPIVLGEENNPVTDIYGVAFTISYNSNLFVPNSVSIDVPTSWFGEPSVNLISVEQLYNANGLIELAISRTDQNNVSGYGTIAYLRGIIDDIEGFVETPIQSIVAIDASGHRFPLSAPTEQITSINEPEVSYIDLKQHLNLFPNPTSKLLTINNPYGLPLTSVEVLDSQGRIVLIPRLEGNTISLSKLSEGMYILKLRIGKYTLYEKVVKTE